MSLYGARGSLRRAHGRAHLCLEKRAPARALVPAGCDHLRGAIISEASPAQLEQHPVSEAHQEVCLESRQKDIMIVWEL